MMEKKIEIIEGGPRDGFQNLKDYISVEDKLKVIDDIVSSGVKHIEHTSFVSPKAIPQLKDAKEITEIVLKKYPDVEFFPLVPNLYGAKTAWELGLKKVSYVVSLSLSHNKANINRTHEESLEEFKKIRENYPELNICLDLATAFGCPFEGKVRNANAVVTFLKAYIDLGVKNVCLCDTIGIANPKQVREIVTAVKSAYPEAEFEVHIHDTRNMGMTNTLAAIEAGITKIQSTLGGLGGCPFAPGASGNLATEDVVFMLNEMDYETGVNFEKIVTAAKFENSMIDGTFSGHNLKIEKITECK
jgi:hydroxymethylglutaryl-CoA lyase